MIVDTYQTGPLPVNTYILKDEESKEAVIIDLGGSFSEIKENLDKEGYTIKFILNTHGHFDHILGEIEVQKEYPQIPIYMHKDDEEHTKNLSKELSYFGYNISSEPIEITKFIDETTELYIGKNKIRIMHTPGHTKGGLSFYIEDKLFSGDALFYSSIGRTDFYDGDYDTLINSIKHKIMTLPPNTTVYPGHGPLTTIYREQTYNAYLR